MHTCLRRFLHSILIILLLSGCAAATAAAQDSRSTALAKELATLLDQAKLDAMAARDPSSPDTYVAALYFTGSQLLVVSARYAVPVLLNEKLAKKDYREVYIDLNSASIAGTKVFVVDLLAEGLKSRRADEKSFDTYETASQRLVCDGDWKAQKMTEEQYMKAFADADAAYAKMLSVLIAQAKKG